MTGIILCEISSGFSISPTRLPDGVVGDSTPITLVAVGAIGAVTWSARPPGNSVETNLWSGRSLIDHGNGTATIGGMYTSASYRGFKRSVYCWDSAGQVASVGGQLVVYESPLVLDGPFTYAGDYQVFVRGGPGPVPQGPTEGEYAWSFSPPLPTGWSYTVSGGSIQIHPGPGAYVGRVEVALQINFELPEERISAALDIRLPA